jgi:DNA-binding MarR family transcriptional regulator
MSALPPDSDIAPAIGAASRGVTAALMAHVSACGFEGVTPALAGLMPLLDAEGARVGVLALRAGVTKQAVSQLLRELEARGYVEQAPDPADTRARIVRLTPLGEALRDACADARRELQVTGVATLGWDRMKRLREDLLALAAALGSRAR